MGDKKVEISRSESSVFETKSGVPLYVEQVFKGENLSRIEVSMKPKTASTEIQLFSSDTMFLSVAFEFIDATESICEPAEDYFEGVDFLFDGDATFIIDIDAGKLTSRVFMDEHQMEAILDCSIVEGVSSTKEFYRFFTIKCERTRDHLLNDFFYKITKENAEGLRVLDLLPKHYRFLTGEI